MTNTQKHSHIEDDTFRHENERGAYYRSAQLMWDVGNKRFGLPMPNELLVKWRYLSVFIKKTDDVIDGGGEEIDKDELLQFALELFGNGVEFNPTTFSDSLLESSLGQCALLLRDMISAEEADALLQHGFAALTLSKKSREVTSVKEYVAIIQEEAFEAWKMYEALIDQNIKQHSNFQSYAKCMENMAESSNTVDTFLDLRLDADMGLVLLNPSIRNRLAILMRAFPKGVRCIKALGLGAVHLSQPTISTYKSSKGSIYTK